MTRLQVFEQLGPRQLFWISSGRAARLRAAIEDACSDLSGVCTRCSEVKVARDACQHAKNGGPVDAAQHPAPACEQGDGGQRDTDLQQSRGQGPALVDMHLHVAAVVRGFSSGVQLFCLALDLVFFLLVATNVLAGLRLDLASGQRDR